VGERKLCGILRREYATTGFAITDGLLVTLDQLECFYNGELPLVEDARPREPAPRTPPARAGAAALAPTREIGAGR
jgi:hypothetical protein